MQPAAARAFTFPSFPQIPPSPYCLGGSASAQNLLRCLQFAFDFVFPFAPQLLLLLLQVFRQFPLVQHESRCNICA